MAVPEFTSKGKPFHVKGRGWVYAVVNPGGIPEPNVFRGQVVLIDGVERFVTGVETFAIGRPYPDRLNFALLTSYPVVTVRELVARLSALDNQDDVVIAVDLHDLDAADREILGVQQWFGMGEWHTSLQLGHPIE